jgi:hypothetical protein
MTFQMDNEESRLPADLRAVLEEKICVGQTLINQLASPRSGSSTSRLRLGQVHQPACFARVRLINQLASPRSGSSTNWPPKLSLAYQPAGLAQVGLINLLASLGGQSNQPAGLTQVWLINQLVSPRFGSSTSWPRPGLVHQPAGWARSGSSLSCLVQVRLIKQASPRFGSSTSLSCPVLAHQPACCAHVRLITQLNSPRLGSLTSWPHPGQTIYQLASGFLTSWPRQGPTRQPTGLAQASLFN